jgi:thiol:disulfide interchange protein DsbC
MGSAHFTPTFLRILTLTSLVSMQTSYAQSNNNQVVMTQEATTQIESTSNENTQKIENIIISVDAYQRIHEFFQSNPNVSIQRYNQQLLEINIGARSFLASNDGRYIYVGKVIDTFEKIDISEQVTQKNRVKALAKFGDKNKLTFPASVKELFAVTLFTDIDCGYCRRFHNNMAQYNALGIRVNYLMFPRAGKYSESYDKTAEVLCSGRPQENMTLAMTGGFSADSSLVDKACLDNLDQQMLLATEFNISATPTMILPNGGVIKGVLNPEKLLAQLKKSVSRK